MTSAPTHPDAVDTTRRPASWLQPASAGILVGLVGFASTFAIILQGLASVGANREQAASGLLALLVAMGLLAMVLGVATRLPISIAWSTPGAALLLTSGVPAGGFPAATGAFLMTAGLIAVSGLWRPFGRTVSAIPPSIANAMLAGILLELCTAPMRAVGTMPALALPIVLVWAVAWRFVRPYAVPIAVVVTLAIVAVATPLPAGALADVAPRLVPVRPVFTLDAFVGLAVPLFIVTMASQNVPGLAVLRSNGYEPPLAPIFLGTGLASGLIAPVGGLVVNLAAITAALCAGPDAHPDPGRRWIASVVAGGTYVVLGLFAGFAAAFVAASPPLLIEAVAGLALLASFGSSLGASLALEDERVPAVLTFAVTASGVSLFGIGAAFWGLVAGGALLALTRLGARRA